MKIFIYLFFITLSMTSAFALSPIVPINLLIGIIATVVFIFRGIINKYKIIINKKDIMLVLFLIIYCVSFIINNISSKNINHALAMICVIFIFYFMLRNILYVYIDKQFMIKIYRYIYIGVIFSSLYCIFEFITKNYITSLASMNDLIYRPTVMLYTPVFGGKLIRARSFAEESGVFALYLNAFAPMAIFYIKETFGKLKQIICISIIIISYCFTFSAGGIGFLGISLIFIFIYYIFEHIVNKKKNIKFNIIISVFIVLIATIYIYMHLEETFYFISPLIDKLTLNNDSGRFERWYLTLYQWRNSSVLQQVLGIGPGQISELYGTGTTSLYIDLLVENGFMALSFFILFIIMNYISIFKINSNKKYLYLISITSVLLQYTIMSNYWFPFLWTIIVLAQIDNHLSINKDEVIKNKNT